jgi:hypothetical protein
MRIYFQTELLPDPEVLHVPADPFNHKVGTAFHLDTEGGRVVANKLDVFELNEQSALRRTAAW